MRLMNKKGKIGFSFNRLNPKAVCPKSDTDHILFRNSEVEKRVTIF